MKFPPHILVMEDDLNVAKGLEMVLNEVGYAVNLAGTGELGHGRHSSRSALTCWWRIFGCPISTAWR